jgi:tripartite-type tricarboxylate transporter receptor subunit TctC
MMQPENRRDAAGLTLAALAMTCSKLFTISILLACAGAHAQNFPTRPVRIISPFGAGGANDLVARLIAPSLTERLGQQVIVENRPGAGGMIGTELGSKAPADGHTLTMVTTTTLAILPAIRALPYDPIKDFAPVGVVGESPYVLVAHPTLPVKDVKGLIALAKARPGQIDYGSAGVGTPGHLAGVMLSTMTGIKLNHISYKAGSQSVTDLLSGNISLVFVNLLVPANFIKSGRLKALAVTTTKRVTEFPKIPTVAESGIAGYEFTLWLGLAVPRQTPDGIVTRLNQALNAALQVPRTRELLNENSIDARPGNQKAFEQVIARDIVKYGKLVKAAGVANE